MRVRDCLQELSLQLTGPGLLGVGGITPHAHCSYILVFCDYNPYLFFLRLELSIDNIKLEQSLQVGPWAENMQGLKSKACVSNLHVRRLG